MSNIELPSNIYIQTESGGLIPASPAVTYRAWAGRYGAARGLTKRLKSDTKGRPRYKPSKEQDAFRHAFTFAARFLIESDEQMNVGGARGDREGVQPTRAVADARAKGPALSFGFFNEWYASNPVNEHLKDYWNNYEGIAIAKEARNKYGDDITTDELADYVAEQVKKGRLILDAKLDDRAKVEKFDLSRLPSWLLAPDNIKNAFPNHYGTWCFSVGTSIVMADGCCKFIEDVRVGDEVLSFDSRGCLVPGRVTRLYENVTDTWLKLSNGTVVTPGHSYLRPDGTFAPIGEIITDTGPLGGQVVDADGKVTEVTAKTIRYSAETAHLFEQHEISIATASGTAALAPEIQQGWRTYNFEVEGTHTYIADGIRVHNRSGPFGVMGDLIDVTLDRFGVLGDIGGNILNGGLHIIDGVIEGFKGGYFTDYPRV